MLITVQKLNHWLNNFYGYGSWQARFWFIGYEEPGGDVPEEVADKFNYFYAQYPKTEATLCDIRDLYQHVAVGRDDPKAEKFATRFDYRFGATAIQSTMWKNLIAFEHSYTNETIPDQLVYQREKFALPAAKREALIPLYPLPGSHTHSWHYNWLNLPGCDFLRSQQRYEEHVFPQRMQTILSKIHEHQPEVVLMYGMKNINALKKSIQEFLGDVSFTIGKGVKQQIPQHHRANLNGTTLLITTQIPALRHNRIETGFDWEMFGEKIKSDLKSLHH